MLVDGVVMIHVELHHRDDLAEFRDEAAEHAGLVHAAQDEARILAGGEDRQEEAVRLLAFSEGIVDQRQRAGDGFQRVRMEFQPVQIRHMEEAHDRHRVRLEHARIGERDATAIVDEFAGSGDLAGAVGKTAEHATDAGRCLGLLIFQRCRKDAGEVTDVLGDQEVVLHEAFHGGETGASLITEAFCDLRLDVEIEALFRLIGQVMHVAADGPEEVIRFLEEAPLVAREHAEAHQLVGIADVVIVFGDPEEGLEIAQTALALLQIGFDDITAVAHPLMPVVTLLELFGYEGARRSGDDFAAEQGGGLVIERDVAPYETSFEQSRADGQVALGHTDHVVERPARMPDLQAEIPHRIEHRLDNLFRPAGLLPWGQKGDVDVGMERHLSPAIAADGDQRQPLGRGTIADRVQPLDGEIVDQAQYLVRQKGISGRGLRPARRRRSEAARDFRATDIECGLQDRCSRIAQRGRVGGAGQERGQGIGHGTAIDDRAALRQDIELRGHARHIRRIG